MSFIHSFNKYILNITIFLTVEINQVNRTDSCPKGTYVLLWKKTTNTINKLESLLEGDECSANSEKWCRSCEPGKQGKNVCRLQL